MIFHSSVRKELSQSFMTTLVVLMTVVMSNMLIQTLGQASRGVINPADVVLVMCLTLLGYSGTVLTLSLFIATISTLSRMYRDSEMVIWFSSGQSLTGLLRPVLRFAWPIMVCILVSAVVIWPWSHQKLHELKESFQARNDIERVSPGKFLEFSGSSGVFFIDKDSPSQESGRNVFISRSEGEWNTTITAKQGHVERVNNERFLSLQDGYQFSHNTNTNESRSIRFDKYQLLIDDAVDIAPYHAPSYAISSETLLSRPTPAGDGELFWRIGQLMCALNLVVLAIALSTVNPRAAGSYQIAKALLVFVIYYNSINLGQRWIAEESMQFTQAMLVIHGATLLIALAWIKAKESNWGIKNLLR